MIEREEILEMPIEELGLSVRSYNYLRKAGIFKVRDLIGKTEADLRKVMSFRFKSKECLEEITAKLHSLGLDFMTGEEY